MKWIGLIVIAVLCASSLGGSSASFAPSSAAADTLKEWMISAAAADSVQRAVSLVDGFICDPHLHKSFMNLIHEDKVARMTTRKDSPAWLKARKNPRAFLAEAGVSVPEEITVAFMYSIPTGSKSGIYCIEACIGSRGGHCASCAHPEKTGCFLVRQCYPIISI